MILNLAYHSISNERYEHAVTPEMFEQQLRVVQRHFRIIPTAELERLLREGADLTEPLATIAFDDGVEDNLTNALPVLTKLQVPATMFACSALAGTTRTNGSGVTFRFLDWDQMHTLEASGLVDVQSHTHTHPFLTRVTPDELHTELRTSKELLEEHLGHPITRLAYPKGNFNDAVEAAAREYYGMAFGPSGVLYGLAGADPYAVPRVIISADIPLAKFRLMMYPAYWQLRSLRNRIFR
jgi:peptidoglycan/xylan/chitin deacetylase (PgdA/CDA1 family)